MPDRPDPADLEAFEYAAWADLVAAAPPALAAATGLAFAQIGASPAVIAPAIASGEFNRGGLAQPGDLEALVAHLRRGAGPAMVQVPAPALGAPLAQSLTAAGCRPAARHWVMLSRGPGAPALPASPLAFRELGAADAAAAGQVFTQAYGMPPGFAPWMAGLITRPHWRGFGAFQGAGLIGVAFLYQRGARALMSGAATLPQARGQGAQSGLLALRIAQASLAGAQLLQSHTGLPVPGRPNPSLNNMRRAGFADAHHRLNWLVHGEKGAT